MQFSMMYQMLSFVQVMCCNHDINTASSTYIWASKSDSLAVPTIQHLLFDAALTLIPQSLVNTTAHPP